MSEPKLATLTTTAEVNAKASRLNTNVTGMQKIVKCVNRCASLESRENYRVPTARTSIKP